MLYSHDMYKPLVNLSHFRSGSLFPSQYSFLNRDIRSKEKLYSRAWSNISMHMLFCPKTPRRGEVQRKINQRTKNEGYISDLQSSPSCVC